MNETAFATIPYTTDKIEVRSLIDKIEKQYITAGEYLQNLVIKKLTENSEDKKPIKSRDFMQAQRGYTWEKWRASNFILAILLQGSIPEITLYRGDTNGQYRKTLDGQQRMTTLYLFANDRFKLEMSKSLINKFYIGKEVYSIKDLQGKLFSELPQIWQDLIMGYSLRILTYNNCSDEQAENIYIQMSEGTKALKAIEIRKAAMGTNVRKFVFEMLNNSWVFHALSISGATGSAGLDIMTQFLTLLQYKKPIEMSKENINEVIYNFRDFGLPQEIIDNTSLTCDYLNDVTKAWIDTKKEIDKEQVKGRKVKKYDLYRFPFLNKTHILMLMFSSFVALNNDIDVKDFQKWAYEFFSEPKGLYKDGLGSRSVKVSDFVSVQKRMQAINEELTILKGEELVNIIVDDQADIRNSKSVVGNTNNDNTSDTADDINDKLEDEQLTI